MQSVPRQTRGRVVDATTPRPELPDRRGVLLLNLGTPDHPTEASVRRYLAEFLSDPAVIRLPAGLAWLNGFLGHLIARFRAPKSLEMYRRIWSERGSPLKSITEDQAEALEEALPRGWRVFYAMRYGRPGIVETLRRIEATGIDELVVVPMYPQYSNPTTGTALRVVYDYLKAENRRLRITMRTTWYDDQGYVDAQAKLLATYATAHGLHPENCHLLFSAHGLPASYVKRGDAYPGHVARSVALVADRLNWPADRMSLAYQSRFGPVKWLTPFTVSRLGQLVAGGEKRILICPISFTTDCLETLEEIDLRYRRRVEEAGSELYLCPALNTFGPFISALKALVQRGPRPASGSRLEAPRLGTVSHCSALKTNPVESLVMVGVSMRGRLGPGRGPDLAFTTADALRRVKRPQCAVPALLREILPKTDLQEGWLANTCHRFEFYGQLAGVGHPASRQHTAEAIRRELFGDRDAKGLNVNILYGAEAWHHLLRTAAGFNSGLPGERDILEQLQAAWRLAGCAGATGPLTERLRREVLAAERALRTSTAWGCYSPDYAFAALSQVAHRIEMESGRPILCGAKDGGPSRSRPSPTLFHPGRGWGPGRIVVIGGSTTSASVLRTLTDRFAVPSERLTLFYRGHRRGGHLKLLRKAIGGGRRVRVQSYDQRCVLDAIAGADVVVFGLDVREPVLTAEALSKRRDLRARPLTIFDFNMFGSTRGLETVPGVNLYDAPMLETQVTRYADRLCRTDSFLRALDEAESWILECCLESGREPRLGASTQRQADGGAPEPPAEHPGRVRGADPNPGDSVFPQWSGERTLRAFPNGPPSGPYVLPAGRRVGPPALLRKSGAPRAAYHPGGRQP